MMFRIHLKDAKCPEIFPINPDLLLAGWDAEVVLPSPAAPLSMLTAF